MPDDAPPDRIASVRRFNRFYTRRIGVLDEGLLRSPFSLTQARVLYELAHREPTTASALCETLGLDAGYLSRILRGFQKKGLLEKRPSTTDRRQTLLSLTDTGRMVQAGLDADSSAEIGALLERVAEPDRPRLVAAMDTIERLLAPRDAPEPAYTLRPHRTGDMGWVVERHGVLYDREYGWGIVFEALIAEIVASFIRHFDPQRERCWIAERHGERVGSVFVVRHPEDEGVAKLRLLLVEPSARGLGIGKRLVRECTRFARGAGYRKLTLWTNSVLHTARHIYRQEGYRLVHEAPHHLFGEGLIGQTWELPLSDPHDHS